MSWLFDIGMIAIGCAVAFRRDDAAKLMRLISGDRQTHSIKMHAQRFGARGQALERFRLTAALTSGGSASAERQKANGTSWVNSGEPTETLYDAIGMDGATNDICYCQYSAIGRWEIMQKACPPP